MASIFDRFGGGAKDDTAQARWAAPQVPAEPPYTPTVLNQTTSLAPSRVENRQDGGVKYAPALIVGIGAAGRLALQNVIDQVEMDLFADVAKLRFVQFDFGEQAPQLRHRKCDVREISLKKESPGAPVGNAPVRQAAWAAFMYAPKYKDIYTYFSDGLFGLNDLRVYIVLSLREAAVGALPALLQLLRRNHADKVALINVIASLDTPSGISPLKDGEVHAALRELGRFTIRGSHVLPAPVGQQDGSIIDQTLIDQLFVVDAEFPNNPELRKKPFIDGSAQLLSEAVYTLIHPSSDEIRERRKNILTKSSSQAYRLSAPVVHSFSLATLNTPVAELQAYVRARLARAVLLGDVAQAQPGWLQASSNPQIAEGLAKSWMYPQKNNHSIFDWLWSTQEAARLKNLPAVTLADREAYLSMFRWSVVSGVNVHLERESNLLVAWEAADVLLKKLEKLQQWMNQTSYKDAQLPSKGALLQILKGFAKILQEVQAALEEWLRAFYGESLVNSRAARASSSSNLFQIFDTELNLPTVQDGPISQQLDAEVQSAVEKLQRVSQGSFCMPVLEIRSESTAVEEFYKSIVPTGIENGAYLDLRRRLGWWLHEDADKKGLVLSAIFLSDESEMPQQYPASQAVALIESVQRLAAGQAQAVRVQVTAELFNRQAWKKRDLLKRAASLPYLDIDESDADLISLQQETDGRLGYIIAQTEVQGEDYLRIPFDALAQSQRRALPNGEKTRLTAIGFYNYIPLRAVAFFRASESAYRSGANTHLFLQERNAHALESEIREALELNGDNPNSRWFELVAPVTATLWNRNLERLFFRALACGLIEVHLSNQMVFGEVPNYWQVQEIGRFPAFDLASANSAMGLWESYQKFTLIFPANPLGVPPEINTPRNPFLANNRIEFFNAMLKKCETLVRSAETKKRLVSLKDYLVQLRQTDKAYALASCFADLMEFEFNQLSEPLDRFAEPLM